ncbi:MAG: hypothetical protein KC643_18485, partial [Nitrospira sp.]|nr:hypothetical protein [Nitrospira sp.]
GLSRKIPFEIQVVSYGIRTNAIADGITIPIHLDLADDLLWDALCFGQRSFQRRVIHSPH